MVIGGGFSGFDTALELAEQGITNIVVLEAHHLGFGGTGRIGGQIMAGIGHDLEKVKSSVGVEGLRKIFEISEHGAGIIKVFAEANDQFFNTGVVVAQHLLEEDVEAAD